MGNILKKIAIIPNAAFSSKLNCGIDLKMGVESKSQNTNEDDKKDAPNKWAEPKKE